MTKRPRYKSRLPGRDIPVLSHGREQLISWPTSNWHQALEFSSVKVIVRYVESMLSTLYSLCPLFSGLGMVKRFSKKQLSKRAFNKEGHSWWDTWCTCTVTANVTLLIYHKQMKPHNRDSGRGRAVPVHSLAHGEFNFLSTVCVSTISDDFHKENKPVESDNPADQTTTRL